MANDEIVVATSTDSSETATAAAQGDEEGARVPVEQHGSLSEFRHSESGKTRTLSYEAPNSSRHDVERVIEETQAQLAELSTSEAPEESEAETEADLARMAAEQAARHQQETLEQQHRLRLAQMTQQAPGLDPMLQRQYTAHMQQAAVDFGARMKKISSEDPSFMRALARVAPLVQGLDSRPNVTEALVSAGGDVAAYFVRNRAELEKLTVAPDHLAILQIAKVAERMTPKHVRASSAPPPIRPVSGSPTTQAVNLAEADFQTFRRVRNAQERDRYRR